MKENSIKEDINDINKGLYELADSYELYHASWAKRIFESIKEKLDHILSEYKRVLKENEEWDRKFCNLQNLYFKLQDELECKRKEYQETYKDVREELKELRKDNEELKDTNCLVKRYFKLKDTNTYLQKENDELRKIKEISSNITEEDIDRAIKEAEKQYIPVQKVKDKIEEIQKEYNKLDKEVDEYMNDTNKDISKYYENKEKIGTMQTLSWCIDNLQELLKKED